MRKKESKHESSNDERRRVSEWVEQFITYYYKKYQKVGLSEADVNKSLNLPAGIDLLSYVTAIIFKSDLEYLATLTLLSMFSAHTNLICKYFPKFGPLAGMSDNNRSNSLIEFDEQQVLSPRSRFERVIEPEVIEEYRKALVESQDTFDLDFSDEELIALSEFSVQILEKAEKSHILEEESADPIAFKEENIDWKYLIMRQTPGIFYSPDMGGMFSVSVPEKGNNDYLFGTSVSVVQNQIHPSFDNSGATISDNFFVVGAEKNAQLLKKVFKNKILRKALMKMHLLGKAQLMLMDKVGELFEIAAMNKADELLGVKESIANYFIGHLLNQIESGMATHFVTTAEAHRPSENSKNIVPEIVAYQFSIEATDGGAYLVSVAQRQLNTVFSTTGIEKDISTNYEIKLEPQQRAVRQRLPSFEYRKLGDNRFNPADSTSEVFNSELLVQLFKSMMPFSDEQVLIIYSMFPKDQISLFSYLTESSNIGALLMALNNVSSENCSVGKRFLVPAKSAIQFVRGPKKGEVYVAKFDGTSMYQN